MNPLSIIGLVVLVFSILIGGGTRAAFGDRTVEVPIPPKEQPQQPVNTTGNEAKLGGTCDWENGWNVCAIGTANTPEFWRKYKPIVGNPIGPFNPSTACQPFRNVRLCASSTPGYEVQISNTGAEQLERDRLQPNTRSEPHPALADWMKELVSKGLPIERAFGRVLSKERCNGSACIQYTEKIVVEFPEGSTLWDDVKVVPVEEQLLKPPPTKPAGPTIEIRPMPIASNTALLVGYGVATLFGLIGLGSLLFGFTAGNNSNLMR